MQEGKTPEPRFARAELSRKDFREPPQRILRAWAIAPKKKDLPSFLPHRYHRNLSDLSALHR
jgi:hypothetical protein